jgi:hypothetical protein
MLFATLLPCLYSAHVSKRDDHESCTVSCGPSTDSVAIFRLYSTATSIYLYQR